MAISTQQDNRDSAAGAAGARSQHNEWLMDEGIRDSFPASDPTSSSQPGSLVGERYARRERATTRRIESDSAAFWWLIAGCASFCAGFIAGQRRRRRA